MTLYYPRYQFVFFRVVFGLYLLMHFVDLIPVASEIWSSSGFLSDAKLNLTYGAFPNLLYVLDSSLEVTIFVCVLALLSLCIVFGFYRRTVSLLLWYGWACLLHQNNLILNPGLPMVGWLLLALAIIPKGEGWSIEAEDANWQMPPILFWGAWMIAGIAYTISGIDKAMAPSWQDGTAMSHLLHSPLARDYFVRDFLLSSSDTFKQFLTWGALALEIGFGFLVLFSKTRFYAWLMIMLMHLGVLLIIDFPDLTLGVMMFHLFTFDARWFQGDKKERVVIFDGVCGFCNKSIDTLIKMDEQKLFRYTSLQGEYVKELDIPEGIDSIILYEDRKLYYKSTAILKIVRSLGGLGILANVFYIIPRFMRDFIYDIIAKYRYAIFGKMDACRMPAKGEEALFLD